MEIVNPTLDDHRRPRTKGLRTVTLSVCQSISTVQFAGYSAGQPASQPVSQSVSQLVSRSIIRPHAAPNEVVIDTFGRYRFTPTWATQCV